MRHWAGKWGVAGLIVAAMLVASVPTLFAQSDRESAKKELALVAEEYQEAMNSYNMDKIIPRLADKLELWMPLGIQITTPDEFRGYMKAMANLIGIGSGGKYTIERPKTAVRYFEGGDDNVFSAGTIDEEVQFTGKRSKKYVSNWLIHLQKQGGTWKIVGGNLDVDAGDFPKKELDAYKEKVLVAMKEKTEKDKTK